MTFGSNTIDGTKMMDFVRRVEAEDKLKQIHTDNIAAICAEAKATGLLPKGIRAIVAARKLKPSLFRENEDLRDIYFHAAGLAEEPPLFRQIAALASDDMGRAAVIERMKKLVPIGGSIIVELDGPPVRLTRDQDGNVRAEEIKPRPMNAGAPAGSPAPERPTIEVPNVSADEAEHLGGKAFHDDEPITANPFPYGDKRQARWDTGYRKASGDDGMGPQ